MAVSHTSFKKPITTYTNDSMEQELFGFQHANDSFLQCGLMFERKPVCCGGWMLGLCVLCSVPCFVHSQVLCSSSGVMLAVDAIIGELKKLSKPVTTPEEIAQVRKKIPQ